MQPNWNQNSIMVLGKYVSDCAISKKKMSSPHLTNFIRDLSESVEKETIKDTFLMIQFLMVHMISYDECLRRRKYVKTALRRIQNQFIQFSTFFWLRNWKSNFFLESNFTDSITLFQLINFSIKFCCSFIGWLLEIVTFWFISINRMNGVFSFWLHFNGKPILIHEQLFLV